jgi:hypothetical protein
VNSPILAGMKLLQGEHCVRLAVAPAEWAVARRHVPLDEPGGKRNLDRLQRL